MDARLDELLTRLIEIGTFPGISCSEGHELVDLVRCLKADNGRLYDLLTRGEIIAKEIYEEHKLELDTKNKRIAEMRHVLELVSEHPVMEHIMCDKHEMSFGALARHPLNGYDLLG